MAGVRSMLSRVQRLEQARAPAISPFARAYGSFDAFVAHCEANMAAGLLDTRDFPVVLHCLRQWESDGTWGRWSRRDNTWGLGH